jgi:hypothetical protein
MEGLVIAMASAASLLLAAGLARQRGWRAKPVPVVARRRRS